MKTIEEMISQIREGLDEMVAGTPSSAEWHQINAIRFMENYRIMLALENEIDGAREEGVR